MRISDKSGHLESLRDVKAGEENMIWFRELIQIGIKCSSEEKKKRPPMQEVGSLTFLFQNKQNLNLDHPDCQLPISI